LLLFQMSKGAVASCYLALILPHARLQYDWRDVPQ